MQAFRVVQSHPASLLRYGLPRLANQIGLGTRGLTESVPRDPTDGAMPSDLIYHRIRSKRTGNRDQRCKHAFQNCAAISPFVPRIDGVNSSTDNCLRGLYRSGLVGRAVAIRLAGGGCDRGGHVLDNRRRCVEHRTHISQLAFRRTASSKRSAALATLSVGLVIRVASSRARVA
jgi:hypothetical protein